MKTTTALMALMLALAACGSGIDAEGDADTVAAGGTTTTTTVATTESPDDGQPGVEPAEVEDVDDTPRTPIARTDLSREVDMATADLASRLGMGDADIVVFSAESVVWRDGSLGCPVEGRAYTQALVQDGYRIILTANGENHYFHGAGTGDPFLCEDPQEPYTGTGTSSKSPGA